jgi:hypothetical protein
VWLGSVSADFVSVVLANIVSGALVAAGAYLLVERRFNLRRERDARREMMWDALSAIRDELKSNRERVDLFTEHLSSTELPYPPFEASGWDLLSQAQVFTILSPETAASLVKLYKQLATINAYYGDVQDFMFGRTAVSAATSLATLAVLNESAYQSQRDRFEHRRLLMLQRLGERVRDLAPLLEETEKVVEDELERSADGRRR